MAERKVEPLEPTIRKAIRAYDEKNLMCRFARHAWDFLGFFRQEGEIVAAFRCPRCKTVREQFMDTQGNFVGNVYHYKEGYRVPTGERRNAKGQDFRQEMIRRSRIYADAASVLPEELL